jgi:hypothetical protein
MRGAFQGAAPFSEHDPEKRVMVFRTDHAPNNEIRSRPDFFGA